MLAAIGGFRVSGQVRKTWRRKELQVDVVLDRTGEDSELTFSIELTAPGLISRLEHALDHFEAELAEQRRAVIENTRRIADYEPQLGGAFALAAELAAKQADLAALKVSLAATAEQADAEADDLDGILPRLRSAAHGDGEGEEDELEAA